MVINFTTHGPKLALLLFLSVICEVILPPLSHKHIYVSRTFRVEIWNGQDPRINKLVNKGLVSPQLNPHLSSSLLNSVKLLNNAVQEGIDYKNEKIFSSQWILLRTAKYQLPGLYFSTDFWPLIKMIWEH